jgi:hypothetical protein
MSRLYTTQDYFKIELGYDEPLEDTVATAKIKYQKPDGVIGEWDAVHDAEEQTVTYTSPVGEPLTLEGKWNVWSYLTITTGHTLVGHKFKFTVKSEIPQ